MIFTFPFPPHARRKKSCIKFPCFSFWREWKVESCVFTIRLFLVCTSFSIFFLSSARFAAPSYLPCDVRQGCEVERDAKIKRNSLSTYTRLTAADALCVDKWIVKAFISQLWPESEFKSFFSPFSIMCNKFKAGVLGEPNCEKWLLWVSRERHKLAFLRVLIIKFFDLII